MGNLFDSVNYPAMMPDKLVIGDRWQWRRDDLAADYPLASYSLKYSLRLDNAATEIEITAIESDGTYLVEVSSVSTAGYTSGTYRWQVYITRSSDGERVKVDSGTVVVLSDNDSASVDPRSTVKQILDAVEATILRVASRSQQSISVDGKTLASRPYSELILLRDRFKTEYQSELKAERIRRGLDSQSNIKVRL